MKSSLGRQCNGNRGFTIVELMIALLLSLFLLAAITYIVVNSNKNYNSTDSLARLQENARFAMGYMTSDLRRAGYSGCMGDLTTVKSSLNGNLSITTNASETITLSTKLEGVNDIGGTFGNWYPSGVTFSAGSGTTAISGSDAIAARYLDGAPVNISESDTLLVQDMKFEADSLVVSSTYGKTINVGDIVAVADCSSVDILQVTGKSGSGPYTLAHAALSGACTAAAKNCPGNSTASLSKAYTTKSGSKLLKFGSFSYYVGTNANGRSALFRGTSGGAVEELVEGVENMQIMYGELAKDANNKPIPPMTYRTAKEVTDWNNIVSARIGLLFSTVANSTDGQSGNAVDLSTYNYKYTVNGVDVNVPVGQERRLRRVFTTTVALRNATLMLSGAP
jgi:type IV pilus assembly protein PilW